MNIHTVIMSLTAHKVEEPEVKEGETKHVKEMVK